MNIDRRMSVVRNGKHPTFIDLFCGAGGLALGFRMAGYHSAWALDSDPASVATYKMNFGHKIFCGDIKHAQPPFPKADVIIGGPPCQGFSPLGVMSPAKGHGSLRELWKEYTRILAAVRPKAFVVENVPEFLKSRQYINFARTVARYGYKTTCGVLNAADYGVPQKRRRGLIIGSRTRQPTMPPPALKRVTVRDAIGDLPRVPDGNNWHIGRDPRPKSVERYKCVPPGGNRFDLVRKRPDLAPRCWIRKKTGSTDVFGRLEWDKPALTIRTEFFKPEKGRYLHPEADRPITHREAARLMGFPDGFKFVGGRIAVARQIGNAVPPPLAMAIAKHLRPLVSNGKS